MRLLLPQATAAGQRSGFTMVEALVVTTTMVILCAAMILCNLYGVSMAVRQQIWLSASDDAAQTLGKLMSDIRGGASNYVGSYTGNGGLANFSQASTTSWQQGNALEILQANTNGGTNGAWIIYYYDPPTSNLYRTNYTTSGSGHCRLLTANPIMTNNMYNSNIFSAYCVNNATGTWVPQTNGVGTTLVLVCLAFTKLQNPQVEIAPGSPVDFYQIVTMIASRNRP